MKGKGFTNDDNERLATVTTAVTETPGTPRKLLSTTRYTGAGSINVITDVSFTACVGEEPVITAQRNSHNLCTYVAKHSPQGCALLNAECGIRCRDEIKD